MTRCSGAGGPHQRSAPAHPEGRPQHVDTYVVEYRAGRSRPFAAACGAPSNGPGSPSDGACGWRIRNREPQERSNKRNELATRRKRRIIQDATARPPSIGRHVAISRATPACAATHLTLPWAFGTAHDSVPATDTP